MSFEEPDASRPLSEVEERLFGNERSSLISPPRRESWPTLVIGLLLFLAVLALFWYRDSTRGSISAFASSLAARQSTYFVEALAYWDTQGDTIHKRFLSSAIPRQALSTAELWTKVSAQTPKISEKPCVALDAAALYGVADCDHDARQWIQFAAQLDHRHAPVYHELLSLYRTPARPVVFTAEAEAVLQQISAGPLMRARNAELRHDQSAALAALRPGKDAGLRVLISNGIVLAVGLILFIFALVIYVVYRGQITASLDSASVAPPGPALPWDIGTAFILISLTLIMALGISQGLLRLLGHRVTEEMHIPIAVVGEIVGAIIVLGVFLMAKGYKPWQWGVFGWRKVPRAISYGIVVLLSALPLIGVVTLVSRLLFPKDVSANPIIMPLLTSHSLAFRILLVLIAVIMAPIIEETLFRGILFGALRHRISFWWSALISGFLFALLHGQLAGILPIMAVGVLLAFLVWRTGSLRASAAAHAAYNGLLTGMLLLQSWSLQGPGA